MKEPFEDARAASDAACIDEVQRSGVALNPRRTCDMGRVEFVTPGPCVRCGAHTAFRYCDPCAKGLSNA